MKKTLYLDDLKIGDTFVSGSYHLTKEQIIQFATEYDPQVFHCDESLATDTFFGGLAASGWHTAAITMKLIVASLPFAAGVIGLHVDLSWPRPTRPDETLHVKSEILEITPSKSKPNQAVVLVQCDTLNQDGELCQRLISKLLCFQKP